MADNLKSTRIPGDLRPGSKNHHNLGSATNSWAEAHVESLLVGGVQVLGAQGAAIADVVEADADATYGQPEADLINEIKAQVNDILAALRAHGLIAT